jgi:hypothetical protein
MVNRDSKSEDDWFRLNEKELLETARQARLKREQERVAKEKAEETKRLKDLHFKKCPKCGHDMKDEQLDNVAVERCTHCEGIFFDAGELEQVFRKQAEERRSFFRKLMKI